MSSRHRHNHTYSAVVAPSSESQQDNRLAEYAASTRRRPNTASEDIFLNLANDATSPRMARKNSDAASSPTKSRIAVSSARSSMTVTQPAHKRTASGSSRRNGFVAPMSPTEAGNTSTNQQQSAGRLQELRKSAVEPDSPALSSPVSPKTNGQSSLLQERLNRRRASNGESNAAPGYNWRAGVKPSSYSRSGQQQQTDYEDTSNGVKLSAGYASRTQRDELESVASTTAPSTVWDELGDLKARIAKLEITGPPPPSSRERNHFMLQPTDPNDRPNTGTTQTSSNSPQRTTAYPPSASRTTFATVPQELHPSLHKALENARAFVDPDTMRYLDSCAADALDLAALCRNFDQNDDGQSVAMSAITTADGRLERRMRRKADNMCRSLTELCIALSQGSNAVSTPYQSRSASFGHGASARALLNDGAAASEYNSPLTYLEQRRARLQDLVGTSGSNARSRSRATAGGRLSDSPAILLSRQQAAFDEDNDDTARINTTQLNRAATVSHQHAEGMYLGDDRDSTIRPISRANTDGRMSSRSPTRAQHQFSRDYTARYPMPDSPSIRDRLSTTNAVPGSYNVASTAKAATNQVPLPSAQFTAEYQAITGDLGDGVTTRKRSLSRGTSNRHPPSVGTGLAERLEARRQARAASASAGSTPLGTPGPTTTTAPMNFASTPPGSAGNGAGGVAVGTPQEHQSRSQVGSAVKGSGEKAGFFSRLPLGFGRRPGSSRGES